MTTVPIAANVVPATTSFIVTFLLLLLVVPITLPREISSQWRTLLLRDIVLEVAMFLLVLIAMMAGRM